MIRAVIMMNTHGKPRLTRFYDYYSPERQQELIRSVYGVLCGRPENVSNFVEAETIFGPDTRMVYKHYATLYFVFVFDSSENELAMLDLIQVFVETLDKCFKNVCELDIIFNFNKMHTILDELIIGGQVLETNSDEVLRAVEEITRYLPHYQHPCLPTDPELPPLFDASDHLPFKAAPPCRLEKSTNSIGPAPKSFLGKLAR